MKCAALVLFALLIPGWSSQSKASKTASTQEQSRFSAEQAAVNEPVAHPVSLPAGALLALGTSEDVASCVKREGVKQDQIPASWFVASEIHLDGPKEIDFVVLPNLDMPPGSEAHGPVGCFLGANIAAFWVVRESSNGYQLALTVRCHDLVVSNHRTDGLRDIQAISIMRAGAYISTVTFRFDGETYRWFSTHSVPQSLH